MKQKIKRLAIILFFLIFGIGYYMRHHHYVPTEVRVIEIKIKDLPDAFDGFKIGHLTDVHCGNYKKEGGELAEGIQLLMDQEPDVVFITGDLIEREVQEIRDCKKDLEKIKASHGVFVTLGNHEYGSTHLYEGRQKVQGHIEEIVKEENALGWVPLLNANKIIEIKGKKLAVIGVENYSTGAFPSEGDLKKASQGTEEADLRLLLSHDPSHWKAEVVKAKLPIAVTFSGHTHGFRLKITRVSKKKGKKNPFHWYPEHHGHYQEGESHLCVSSGLGNSKKFGRRFKKREVVIIVLRKEEAK